MFTVGASEQLAPYIAIRPDKIEWNCIKMPTFSRICPRRRDSPSKPLTDDWVGTSKIRVTARHWYIHKRICSSVCFSQIVGPKGWGPLESGPQASVVKKSSVSFHHASGCMGLRTWLLAPCPCGEESCWFVDTCAVEFPLFSGVRSFAWPTRTSVRFSIKKSTLLPTLPFD